MLAKRTFDLRSLIILMDQIHKLNKEVTIFLLAILGIICCPEVNDLANYLMLLKEALIDQISCSEVGFFFKIYYDIDDTLEML